jgi:hypothetical protein
MKFHLVVILSICACLGCSPYVYTDENLNGETTIQTIVNKYGNPNYADTFMLSRDKNLYEYQRGICKYCPLDDSITVVELTYRKRNILKRNKILKIWYEPIDSNVIKVLDNIEWDPEEVQF